MLVIRLQRTGRRNAPTFRIVVAENSAPIQGKFVEIVGHYLPTRTPSELEFKQERIEHWIGNGAKPTDTVARLLSKSGVKGLETYIKAYTKRKKKNAPEEEEAPTPAPAAQAPAEEKTEETPVEKAEEEAPTEEVKEEPAEEVSAEPEATEDEKTPEEDKKEEETDATEAEVDKEEEGDNEEKSS